MKNNLPGLKNRLKNNKITPVVRRRGSSNELTEISNMRLLIQNNLFPFVCWGIFIKTLIHLSKIIYQDDIES